MIQERKTTSGGNKKVNKSLFNILKQPVSVCSEYEGGVLNKLYSYDRAGRLIHERHCVVGKDTVDLLYGYDKLGRLKRLERIHGKDSVITENAYNIRSWLTGIDSNAGFVEQLHYVDGLGDPCYNGNISSMTWEADGVKRGYKFMYDGRSRLLRAVYGEGEGLNVNQDRFNEEITGYDKNGNILGIKRCGKRSEDEYGLIDNLVMSYNGNQLKAVTDSVTSSAHADSFEFKDGADLPVEYYYDSNGNLIQDLNKKISEIQYNCLNLPSRIEFEDGGVISYLYDAKGTKFRTTHIIAGKTTTTDYFDDAIYENGVLTTLLTELGYISLVDGKYHYYLKDHQGNNRVVVGQNGSVEEVNHYYPFGGTFASTSSVQPYKYNGKELDRQGGLDWYDYGARHYDVALGRWHVVDPMAEEYYGISPHVYVANNPLKYIDLNGDSISVAELYERDDQGKLINSNQVKAFEFLMSTKEGKALLANYAMKGQTIAGFSFSKDGKYHNKGINISFGAGVRDASVSGTTSFSLNDENLNVQIMVGNSSDNADLLDTFIHEIVIHADQSSADFSDDKVMNNSNVYPALRKMDESRGYKQHWQERNVNKAMTRIGLPIMQQYYNSQGIVKSNSAILKLMYGFRN